MNTGPHGGLAIALAFFSVLLCVAAGASLIAPARSDVEEHYRGVGAALVVAAVVAGAAAWFFASRGTLAGAPRRLLATISGLGATLLAALLLLVVRSTVRSPLHDRQVVDTGPLGSLALVAFALPLAFWLVLRTVPLAHRGGFALVATWLAALTLAVGTAGLTVFASAPALATAAAARPEANTVYSRPIPGAGLAILLALLLLLALARARRH